MPHDDLELVGARALVRAKHHNSLVRALWETPTFDDLGAPLTIIGVGPLAERPASASLGEGYIAVDAGISTVYAWDGAEWVDGGTLQGPQGETGVGVQGPKGVKGDQGDTGPGFDTVDGEIDEGDPRPPVYGIAFANLRRTWMELAEDGGPSTWSIDALRMAGLDKVHVSDAEPTPVDDGYVWFDSVNGTLQVRDDDAWVEITGEQGAPGEDGADGINGTDGADGAQGPIGESGVTVDDDFGLGVGELVVGGVSGPDGLAAPTNTWSLLRNVGGIPTWKRGQHAYLSDGPDIPMDGTDGAPAINAYLSYLASQNIRHVYVDAMWNIETTIEVPEHMTLEGAPNATTIEATIKGGTGFRANADDLLMVHMDHRGASLDSITFNANNKLNIVGVRPNGSRQFIERCGFWLGTSGGCTAIKGGGILYLTVRDCALSNFDKGIEMLKRNADVPSAVYYGTNLSLIENNIFGGSGAIKMDGSFSIVHNTFEGGGTDPALWVFTDDVYSIYYIDDNYFECWYDVVPVLLGGSSRGHLTNNQVHTTELNFVQDGYSSGMIAFNNGRSVDGVTITDTNNPNGLILGATENSGLTTRTTNKLPNGAKWYATTEFGHVFGGGGIRGNVNRVDDERTQIRVQDGLITELRYDTPTTVTPIGYEEGQIFAIRISLNANVTLPTASWRLLSGRDETPPVDTVKWFMVGHDNTVREIGNRAPLTATKTATFTADANAQYYLCDATTGAITVNLPTATNYNGTRFTIKKTDATANTVIVDGNSSQTIDGATTKTITTQYGFIDIVANAVGWSIVGQHGTIT